MKLRKGSVIKVKQRKYDNIINYMVVMEREKTDVFRLLNMDSLMIMSGFKVREPKGIIGYIEDVLKCDILDVSQSR